MRFAGMCMLAALGALPQPARADSPVSGAVLGQLEAVLEHCDKVSPGSAERYREVAKGLTGNATDEELAEVRKGAEYRDAHDAASEELGKLPKAEAAKACVEGLQAAGT